MAESVIVRNDGATAANGPECAFPEGVGDGARDTESLDLLDRVLRLLAILLEAEKFFD